jgi:hypothetical protein
VCASFKSTALSVIVVVEPFGVALANRSRMARVVTLMGPGRRRHMNTSGASMFAFLKRRWCIALIVALSTAAGIVNDAAAGTSQADSPGGYSHLIAVTVSGPQKVVRLPLPRAVYLEAHSSDLRDLRLFDATGTPMPFALVEPTQQARLPRLRDSVVLQPAPGQQGQDLVYTAPIAIPVGSVALVFNAENAVLAATLGQYQERPAGQGGADLEALVSTTFYQWTRNGRRRVSGDIEVPVTHATRWVLRPKGALPERPALRLGWQPATVVFMAGGRAPYTLAFGRDGAQPVYLPLAQVAPGFSQDELAGLEQAVAGAPVRQHDGRDDHAGSAAGLAGLLRQRSVWLWGLLLCGVAMLTALAWRLARQLKDGSSDQPPA